MSSSVTEEYYEQLIKEIKEAKEKNKQRSSKKDIAYIENDPLRRSTYSRRGESLVLAAKEIEVQTRCRVGVMLVPTWANGKTHCHKTSIEDISSTTDDVTSPPPPSNSGDAVPKEGSSTTPVPSSPAKRHPVVKPILKPILSKPKPKEICRLCGQTSETSFWLGCSYRNPRSKKQNCIYWVHQNCVGLYYKAEKDLKKVPFYCKKHAPIYKKK